MSYKHSELIQNDSKTIRCNQVITRMTLFGTDNFVVNAKFFA